MKKLFAGVLKFLKVAYKILSPFIIVGNNFV
jgi:hypothetical protein